MIEHLSKPMKNHIEELKALLERWDQVSSSHFTLGRFHFALRELPKITEISERFKTDQDRIAQALALIGNVEAPEANPRTAA